VALAETLIKGEGFNSLHVLPYRPEHPTKTCCIRMDSIECCDLMAGFQTMHDGRDDLNFYDFGNCLALDDEADHGPQQHRRLTLSSIRSGQSRSSDKNQRPGIVEKRD
jgi:hypothetical protein